MLALALALVVSGCEEEAKKEAAESGEPNPCCLAPPVTYIPHRAYILQSSSIDIRDINPTTGALSGTGSHGAGLGDFPWGIVTDPAGKFLYVPNLNSANVSAYAINFTTGVLSAVAGSPFAATGNPTAAAVHPSGKFLYVVDNDPTTSNLHGFTIDASTGALTAIPGSPWTLGVQSIDLTFDAAGKYVYVTNSATPGSISGFSINATSGALTALPASPYATGNFPSGVAVGGGGKYLYYGAYNLGSNSAVDRFTISSTDGSLSAFTPGVATGLSFVSAVATDPGEKFLYVTRAVSGTPQGWTALSGYAIDAATGALTPVAGSPYMAISGTDPFLDFVAVDPTGKFLFTSSSFGTKGFDGFAITATSGALTQIAGMPSTGGTNLNTKGLAITKRAQ